MLLALAVTALALWPAAASAAARPAGVWMAAATGAFLGAALSVFDDLAELFTTPTGVGPPPTGTTLLPRPTRQGTRP
ncbi:hypothetical protein ABZX75_33680 [Streptomyces sp. NPDC003038]|uniref:hypothetical protein n=1 Tax=unclassified Streptomyces TaxID=2593676 RepID=UPI0033B80595